jgi:hypothetical protein
VGSSLPRRRPRLGECTAAGTQHFHGDWLVLRTPVIRTCETDVRGVSFPVRGPACMLHGLHELHARLFASMLLASRCTPFISSTYYVFGIHESQLRFGPHATLAARRGVFQWVLSSPLLPVQNAADDCEDANTILDLVLSQFRALDCNECQCERR